MFKSCNIGKKSVTLHYIKNAVVAQLVEHGLPKPRVAGSNPVYRSFPLATHIKQGKTSTRSLSLFIILYELNQHDEKALSSGRISNVLIEKNSWRAGGVFNYAYESLYQEPCGLSPAYPWHLQG